MPADHWRIHPVVPERESHRVHRGRGQTVRLPVGVGDGLCGHADVHEGHLKFAEVLGELGVVALKAVHI